jgi:hypothetical protein
VIGDDGRQWRISPSLLSPVKDVDVTAGTGQSKKGQKKKRLR